ncbi:MAG: rRNA adenine dimethyltransferase family protein [Candidatus Saccharimonas sp.]
MKRQVQTYGQHFLRDSAFIAELVGHSNVRKNDLVLDIGAGSGAITDVLSRRAKKVVAYEAEPEAATKLRYNLSRRDNVEIIEKDFLSSELPSEPYKVFSNIPFHLSSKIVRKLVTNENSPKAIYLIVQKQFAQKMLPDGNHFHGALGMAIAPWWVPRIRRPLRKTDFTPPPAVDTVLLELKPRETPLLPREQMTHYMQFVEQCYAEPRFYAKAGGPKAKKPSELTIDEWVQLAKRSVR